jgi:uncharacterized membrane protein YhfC
MKISPLFLISRIGMVGVAVIPSLCVLSIGGTWSALLLGGLAWIVSVAFKFAWSIPTNKPILSFLKRKLPAKLSGPISWSYIGLLTGIFECGIALAFVLKLDILYQATWADILAFGIGFGATEALVLGLISLCGGIYYIFRSQSITEKDRVQWNEGISVTLLWMPIPTVERASTLCIHVFSNVLIILAVQHNIYLLFWLSFGFKTLVDGIAGWMSLEKDIENVTKASQMWAYQTIFVILAVVSLLGIILLQKI